MVFLDKRAVAIYLYLYDFTVLLILWRMTMGIFCCRRKGVLGNACSLTSMDNNAIQINTFVRGFFTMSIFTI